MRLITEFDVDPSLLPEDFEKDWEFTGEFRCPKDQEPFLHEYIVKKSNGSYDIRWQVDIQHGTCNTSYRHFILKKKKWQVKAGERFFYIHSNEAIEECCIDLGVDIKVHLLKIGRSPLLCFETREKAEQALKFINTINEG